MKVLKGIAIAFTVVLLLVILVCHLLMPFDLPGDVLLMVLQFATSVAVPVYGLLIVLALVRISENTDKDDE